MPDRIPVLLTCYTLEAGGTERQLTEMAKALRASQFAPHVGCLRKQGMRVSELEAAGVPVVEFPVRSLRSWRILPAAWQFWRYCQSQQIHIFHAFDVPTGALLAPLAHRAGVPIVLTSQRAYRAMFPRLYQTLIRRTDRFVDGIVVNCEALRHDLQHNENVPPQRIHLCYNGLDPDRFHPAGRISNDPPTIGTVSVLRPEKGIDLLIDAAAIAQVPLQIVGSGSEQEALEQQARHNKVSCQFTPATRDVEELYRRLSIFVLPSRTEALSNSLMEAMASGCCVIASRVGGSPELVRHGETGLLFDAGNAADLAVQIQRAIHNADERRAMSQAASQFIRTSFTIERAAQCLTGLYRGLLRP